MTPELEAELTVVGKALLTDATEEQRIKASAMLHNIRMRIRIKDFRLAMFSAVSIEAQDTILAEMMDCARLLR